MATRLKSPARAGCTPQSKDDCAAAIKTLGDMQRNHARQTADMNDGIAKITSVYQPTLTALAEAIQAQQSGIQTWCEANRVLLCGEADRLGKTANLITGEVSWRQRPPSVSIRNAEGVIAQLLRLGLERFVRTVRQINKEAILAEPAAARDVPGVGIVTGVEDFVITPFEQQAATEAA